MNPIEVADRLQFAIRITKTHVPRTAPVWSPVGLSDRTGIRHTSRPAVVDEGLGVADVVGGNSLDGEVVGGCLAAGGGLESGDGHGVAVGVEDLFAGG